MKVISFSGPEALESRIAPASVFTYTDSDGDLVKITSSAGTIDASRVKLSADELGSLQVLDLTDATFAGANITIKVVKRGEAGDGLAHVGYLNASGNDLGRVVIKGDLGKIRAGDSSGADGAIKSLSVNSMGRLGVTTGAPDNDSVLQGGLGQLQIRGDFRGTFAAEDGGGENGRIDRIVIGGSLRNGTAAFPNSISADTSIGVVRVGGSVEYFTRIYAGQSIGTALVGGNLLGGLETLGRLAKLEVGSTKMPGSGDVIGRVEAESVGTITIRGSLKATQADAGSDASAVIDVTKRIDRVEIAGDIVGFFSETPNVALASGRILAGDIGLARVGGSIIGHNVASSGEVIATGTIEKIIVGGSVTGGVAADTGTIKAGVRLGKVIVAGDLQGGLDSNSGLIRSLNRIDSVWIRGTVFGGGTVTDGLPAGDRSGFIFAAGADGIGSVRIDGNLLGGPLLGTGSIWSEGPISSVVVNGDVYGLGSAGGIRAATTIGTVLVKGSVIGRDTSLVRITAGGVANPTSDADALAIGKVTILGRAENALIGAGFDTGFDAVNGDVQIGTVVAGRWIASSIVAGIDSGLDLKFGVNDTVIANNTPLLSRIAKVIIRQEISGSPAPNDHNGIVAQQIDSVKIAGQELRLTDAKDVRELSIFTGDLKLREL